MSPTPSKPLILVLVGTDHHPFDRLVRWADRWAGAHRARVVIQHGTAAPPEHAEGVVLLPVHELAELERDATAVVCHGGPGTIAGARSAGIRPIVVARDPAHGEHVDDHQRRFVSVAAAAGEVIAIEDETALHAALDRAIETPAGQRIDPTSRDVAAVVARFGEAVTRLVNPPVRPRLLFIAGWGRSGSTLLDRILGQVPGVFSAGELRDIWRRGALEDRLCGCGSPFRECAVWRKVGEVAFGGWDAIDLVEAQALRDRLDRPWATPLLLGSRVTPGDGPRRRPLRRAPPAALHRDRRGHRRLRHRRLLQDRDLRPVGPTGPRSGVADGASGSRSARRRALLAQTGGAGRQRWPRRDASLRGRRRLRAVPGVQRPRTRAPPGRPVSLPALRGPAGFADGHGGAAARVRGRRHAGRHAGVPAPRRSGSGAQPHRGRQPDAAAARTRAAATRRRLAHRASRCRASRRRDT